MESEAGAGLSWSSYLAGIAASNESGFYSPTLDAFPEVIDNTETVLGVERGNVEATNNWTISADVGFLAKAGFSIDLKKLFAEGIFGDGDQHACK
jgi:hypothetical protein